MGAGVDVSAGVGVDAGARWAFVVALFIGNPMNRLKKMDRDKIYTTISILEIVVYSVIHRRLFFYKNNNLE